MTMTMAMLAMLPAQPRQLQHLTLPRPQHLLPQRHGSTCACRSVRC
jgi:hypothetical protein